MIFRDNSIRFTFGDDAVGRWLAGLINSEYFDIYYYALIITLGMLCCIIIAGQLFKRKGLLSDHAIDYAIIVIPLSVIGCRLYFLLFPYDNISWASYVSRWEDFWNIRNGGLGIYGGVIVGYVVAFIVTKVKKLKYYEAVDCIIPGLLFAQSLGRWGNFFNQEAFGAAVTNPDLQWFPYAVYIDGSAITDAGWYQATFFYESIATMVGFVICLILLRSKHYRDGWCMSFYGLYYGGVRLIIEGLRSDSLFFKVPIFWEERFWDTGIKMSQLVSVVIIVLALVRLCVIYRKEIKALLKKLFKGRNTAKNR